MCAYGCVLVCLAVNKASTTRATRNRESTQQEEPGAANGALPSRPAQWKASRHSPFLGESGLSCEYGTCHSSETANVNECPFYADQKPLRGEVHLEQATPNTRIGPIRLKSFDDDYSLWRLWPKNFQSTPASSLQCNG